MWEKSNQNVFFTYKGGCKWAILSSSPFTRKFHQCVEYMCLYLKFTLINIKILRFLLWIILLKTILEHSPSEFPTIYRTNEIYMNFLQWSSFLNIGWTRSLPRGPGHFHLYTYFPSSLMLYKYMSQLMILQCWKFYLESCE